MTFHEWSPSQSPAKDLDLEQQAISLIEENKDAFAGVHVTDDGRVAIRPASDLGVKLAEGLASSEPELSVQEVVPVSITEATLAGEKLYWSLPAELRGTIVYWAADPARGGLMVVASSFPDDGDRRYFQDFADSELIPVHVRTIEGIPVGGELADDRKYDPGPYAGGARYFATQHSGSSPGSFAPCSTGFPYLRGGQPHLLTGGHCHPKNSDLDHAHNKTHGGVWAQWMGRRCCSSYSSGTGSVVVGNDSQFHGEERRYSGVPLTRRTRFPSPVA